MTPQEKLLLSLKRRDVEGIREALSNGAIPNNSESDNNSLHWALRKKHPLEVISFLCDRGAIPSNSERDNNSLYWALREKNPLEVIKLLFKNRADPKSLPESHSSRQEMIDFLASIKKEEKDKNKEIARSVGEFALSGSQFVTKLNSDVISVVASYLALNEWNENEVERTVNAAKGFYESYSVKDSQRKERAKTKTQSTPTAAAVEDEEELIPNTSIRPASPAVKQKSNQNPDKSKVR